MHDDIFLKEYELKKEEYKKILDTEIFEVRSDKLFAYLFNASDIKTLEWLISKVLDIDITEVLGKVTIQNIRIPLLTPNEKVKYLDVFLEYKDEKFIFELNNNFDGMYVKNILYGFNVSVNNYKVIKRNDEKKVKLKSNQYNETHKVTVINLNWHCSKKLRECLPGVVTHYIPYSEKNNKDYLYRVMNVNLDYFEKISYNEVDNSQKFFKLLTISNLKDLREILECEEMLKEYGKRLIEFSKKERDDYMDVALKDYLREYELRLGGYLTGEEDGLEKGRNAEKMELTMGMINENFGYEVISKITGLSISEIEELAKNNKDKN